MRGKTRKRNKEIRDNLGIESNEEKITENCLRWFGHVYRGFEHNY